MGVLLYTIWTNLQDKLGVQREQAGPGPRACCTVGFLSVSSSVTPFIAVGVSKQDIREQIWDYMESRNLADFPRPVHHRIPNFKGSYLACQNIKDLEVFARTQEVKVDPDKPLEGVRLLALQSKKTLLVPTPRLRTGLFNKITPPPGATKDILRKCATSQGVRNYSTPVGLDSRVLVDLVVVGSVAVSEKGKIKNRNSRM
ncbi:Methenyltetrahydrofolate synthase domain-containing protein, partial [Eschrichtius robustus]|nr:Methenyltetrahydrofolate synthase domain-containing protein [Eschrichtius robustus]